MVECAWKNRFMLGRSLSSSLKDMASKKSRGTPQGLDKFWFKPMFCPVCFTWRHKENIKVICCSWYGFFAVFMHSLNELKFPLNFNCQVCRRLQILANKF